MRAFLSNAATADEAAVSLVDGKLSVTVSRAHPRSSWTLFGDELDAVAVARRVVAAMAEPYSIDGRTLVATILRGGKLIDIAITPGRRPASRMQPPSRKAR